MADRVRMNTIALATTALAQSPSFWHAGNDLLRSKSLDRNTFTVALSGLKVTIAEDE